MDETMMLEGLQDSLKKRFIFKKDSHLDAIYIDTFLFYLLDESYKILPLDFTLF